MILNWNQRGFQTWGFVWSASGGTPIPSIAYNSVFVVDRYTPTAAVVDTYSPSVSVADTFDSAEEVPGKLG
jgi:hypothetical protein